MLSQNTFIVLVTLFNRIKLMNVDNVVLRSTISYKTNPIIQSFPELELGDNGGIQIFGQLLSMFQAILSCCVAVQD